MRMISNRLPAFVVLLAFVAGVFFASPSARAEETKIAVVNVQKILSDSLAAKSIQTQLDKQRKLFQDEFSKHERELLDKEKTLVDLRAKLPADEFEKKNQEYKDEVQRVQKLVQDRRQALDQAAGAALNELRGTVLEIVGDISDKEKYDIVLSRQNVITMRKEMDITDKVMVRLDKALSQVPLKVETH